MIEALRKNLWDETSDIEPSNIEETPQLSGSFERLDAQSDPEAS